MIGLREAIEDFRLIDEGIFDAARRIGRIAKHAASGAAQTYARVRHEPGTGAGAVAGAVSMGAKMLRRGHYLATAQHTKERAGLGSKRPATAHVTGERTALDLARGLHRPGQRSAQRDKFAHLYGKVGQ